MSDKKLLSEAMVTRLTQLASLRPVGVIDEDEISEEFSEEEKKLLAKQKLNQRISLFESKLREAQGELASLEENVADNPYPDDRTDEPGSLSLLSKREIR